MMWCLIWNGEQHPYKKFQNQFPITSYWTNNLWRGIHQSCQFHWTQLQFNSLQLFGNLLLHKTQHSTLPLQPIWFQVRTISPTKIVTLCAVGVSLWVSIPAMPYSSHLITTPSPAGPRHRSSPLPSAMTTALLTASRTPPPPPPALLSAQPHFPLPPQAPSTNRRARPSRRPPRRHPPYRPFRPCRPAVLPNAAHMPMPLASFRKLFF